MLVLRPTCSFITRYRCDNTSGVAKGDQPETIYMVTAGKRYNSG